MPICRHPTLFPVPSRQVAGAWPEVVGHIERALVHSGGRYSSEDFFHALMRREMQLWLVHEADRIVGVVITELRNYPRRRCCRYLLLAGDGFARWQHLQDDIEAWARANGCAAMEMCGRRGWERKLKGWRATHIEMSKEL